MLKGDARARVLPEHLRVEGRTQGPIRDRLGHAKGTTVCVHTPMDVPQTDDAIWDGVLCLWGNVATLMSPSCARGKCAYRNEPERVRWLKIMHPLAQAITSPFSAHRFRRSLLSFSNQTILWSPKCVVARQARFPLSIRLDHGDVLVMDRNRSMSIVRCLGGAPLGDATHRVLSTRRRVALCHRVRKVWPRHVPGQVFGESKWALFGLMILLLSIGVCVLRGHAWIERWRRQRDCNPSGVFPSGLFSLGWRRALATVAELSSFKPAFFLVRQGCILEENYVFSWRCGLR